MVEAQAVLLDILSAERTPIPVAALVQTALGHVSDATTARGLDRNPHFGKASGLNQRSIKEALTQLDADGRIQIQGLASKTVRLVDLDAKKATLPTKTSPPTTRSSAKKPSRPKTPQRAARKNNRLAYGVEFHGDLDTILENVIIDASSLSYIKNDNRPTLRPAICIAAALKEAGHQVSVFVTERIWMKAKNAETDSEEILQGLRNDPDWTFVRGGANLSEILLSAADSKQASLVSNTGFGAHDEGYPWAGNQRWRFITPTDLGHKTVISAKAARPAGEAPSAPLVTEVPLPAPTPPAPKVPAPEGAPEPAQERTPVVAAANETAPPSPPDQTQPDPATAATATITDTLRVGIYAVYAYGYADRGFDQSLQTLVDEKNTMINAGWDARIYVADAAKKPGKGLKDVKKHAEEDHHFMRVSASNETPAGALRHMIDENPSDIAILHVQLGVAYQPAFKGLVNAYLELQQAHPTAVLVCEGATIASIAAINKYCWNNPDWPAQLPTHQDRAMWLLASREGDLHYMPVSALDQGADLVRPPKMPSYHREGQTLPQIFEDRVNAAIMLGVQRDVILQGEKEGKKPIPYKRRHAIIKGASAQVAKMLVPNAKVAHLDCPWADLPFWNLEEQGLLRPKEVAVPEALQPFRVPRAHQGVRFPGSVPYCRTG